MSVRIRLARRGTKKRPFYSIVVADSRAARDGRLIEKVGFYNVLLPSDHADRVVLQKERVEHWMSRGASPSATVARLLARAGLIPVPVIPHQTKKSLPKAKAQERQRAAEERSRKTAELS